MKHERGAVPLKQSAPLRMVLFYPNSYAVGMSSLGFQAVFRMLNLHPLIRCERAFFEKSFKDEPVRTIETRSRINEFDVIAVSMSFELDILGLIKGLSIAGIPVYRKDRSDKDPILFLGGVVAGLNPSPLLPIMDGLLVGEGEIVIEQIGDLFAQYKTDFLSKSSFLLKLSEISGIYVPDISNSPIKRHIPNIQAIQPQYTSIVSPKTHFGDMFVVEMSRGCPYGCYFCAGHHIYSPFRSFDKDDILQTIKNLNPGSPKIGLEGAGISSHPDLNEIVQSCLSDNLEVSLSSIRPDRINSEFVDIINQTKIQAFTLAPECGSANLRAKVGKGIKDDTILSGILLLTKTQIRILKLYYLIGLPGETVKDIQAIVDSAKAIADIWISSGKNREIRLSINGFIPKPFTEFQWAPLNTQKELNQKRKMIKKGLQKCSGVYINPKSSKQEILQGFLSLANERSSDLILQMVKTNMTIDQIIQASNYDIEKYVYQSRHFDDPLPWDWIESPVKKELLWKRYSINLIK